ncbi:glycosyltransferase [Methylobacterium radiodurans]|uniref:Glycosyl transferase family 28 n=1 Tax=Methylobacterium radiodurans TaxID=2202828 RepID=A0A2U8VLN8_9HYPH|nr:glycosyltransferase [Methylobacterium radiodurans]AWN34569.1 glycosyl transferase family 28 [Methylobacterium radiodurans]
MRVLIAVTHLLGAGHLTRAAALARAFAAAGHDVVLASGGAPAPLVRLAGVRLVQLPPLHVRGTAFSDLRDADGQPADAALLDRRRSMLLGALAESAPDVLITELFPFGRRALAGEFLALVEAARARAARPLVLASIRDILVAPEKPGRVAETHARVAALYDAVLVHADPALAPLDASWPVDTGLAPRLRYTGYVDEGGAVPEAAERAGILVSAGSSAAGLGMLAAAAEAARRRPDLGWRILVGHGVPEADFSALGAGLPPGTVERARPDYRALLARAALAVSQCGYNTAVDLLATGTPAVLVPFEAGRETEQRLRAERFAERGLARVLAEAGLDADALLRTIAEAPRAPLPPHGLALDGAGRTVALVEAMVRDRASAAPSQILPPPSAGEGGPCVSRGREWEPRLPEKARPSYRAQPEPEAGFPSPPLLRRVPSPAEGGGRAALDRLRAALDRHAETHPPVPVWWRDDDAVAATPALDRLLALGQACAAPILLAAIPAHLAPSLGRRLDGVPGVRLAVHGLAHANHAPAGEKPAEFGPHRPLAALISDAREGLRRAGEHLPATALLPVFVPPWNRIAPDLAAALPDLGYAGLSAATPRQAPPEQADLVRADIHIDPIDWRGTRSLTDPERLVDDLVARLDTGGPVGILTHHLAHDGSLWAFLEALLPLLVRHPAVTVLDPRHLFARAPVDAGAAPWSRRGARAS